MAVEKEVVGLHNIAEKLQDQWEVVAGREQRTQGEELEYRRAEMQPNRRY